MQDDFDDGVDLPEDDVVEEEVTITDVEYTVPDEIDLEPEIAGPAGRMSGGTRVRPPAPARRPAAKAAPKPTAAAGGSPKAGTRKKAAKPAKKKAAARRAAPAKKKKAAAKKKAAPRKAKRAPAKKRKAGAKK